MNAVLHRFVYGLAVALAWVLLSGCTVTTGVNQARLPLQRNVADPYIVCTGVYASRLRERAEAGRVCRRFEEIHVVL